MQIPTAAKFGRFFGGAASTGAGFAIGVATAPTLNPVLQSLANEAWERHPDLPLDPALVAEGVASGEIPREWGEDEAKRSGVNKERFGRLVDVADTGPGIGQAFRLWRRDLIDTAGFKRALKRGGLEDEWIEDLAKTKTEPLDVAVIANAIQQGFIADAGILPDAAPGGPPFNIPTETVGIDGIEEAAWSGVPSDHLKVLAYLSGNPPGPETLGDLLNRGIITEAAYEQGIREGRTKTKWIPALKLGRFRILTAIQAVNLWLRGWITEGEAKAHGEKAGYSAELMELLYKGQGRPLSMRQAFIGHQRGGVYDGPDGQIPEYFLRALKQSSLRPEWNNLAWAQRHSLPSAFVIRGLATSGDLTREQANGLLIDSGWPDDLAESVSQSWAEPKAEGEEAHVKKAQTQLWSSLHSSYLAGDANDTVARDKLPKAGVAADDVADVLALWKEEREVIRQRMTPTQVKKAYTKAVTNTATGAAWTRDDALSELLSRGWSAQDATAFLDQ